VNLIATRRLGEISAGMEKGAGRPPKVEILPERGKIISKSAALADAGIDIRRANEAERIAKLDEAVFGQVTTFQPTRPRRRDTENIISGNPEKATNTAEATAVTDSGGIPAQTRTARP